MWDKCFTGSICGGCDASTHQVRRLMVKITILIVSMEASVQCVLCYSRKLHDILRLEGRRGAGRLV